MGKHLLTHPGHPSYTELDKGGHTMTLSMIRGGFCKTFYDFQFAMGKHLLTHPGHALYTVLDQFGNETNSNIVYW